MLRLTALLLLGLNACQPDETLARYAGEGSTWRLSEIGGAPARARATLTFTEPGALAGEAPCNAYRAAITAPYPWFELGPLAVTRRACPDLAAETAYLNALAKMTLAEVSGDTLILSNDDGDQIIFRRQ